MVSVSLEPLPVTGGHLARKLWASTRLSGNSGRGQQQLDRDLAEDDDDDDDDRGTRGNSRRGYRHWKAWQIYIAARRIEHAEEYRDGGE